MRVKKLSYDQYRKYLALKIDKLADAIEHNHWRIFSLYKPTSWFSSERKERDFYSKEMKTQIQELQKYSRELRMISSSAETEFFVTDE